MVILMNLIFSKGLFRYRGPPLKQICRSCFEVANIKDLNVEVVVVACSYVCDWKANVTHSMLKP